MTTESGLGSRLRYVIPIEPGEIEDFETQVKRFRAGEWREASFMAFRLRQGVYGQRQPNEQMIRIKAPYGGLTADQMDALGDAAEKYAPLKKGHITTRENVQIHHVSLDKTAEMLQMLAGVGLSTREACGNTVRNVTGCAKAGVCEREPFDVSPYAAAYARYFVRHPVSQSMPRKVKTAFSGCDVDCAITPIHDVGFIPKVQDGKRGFEMVVGGGLSIMPRLASTLYDFVSVEDYLRVTEACLRIFDRSDEERKNRMKARIKFMVHRLGIDEFRRQVEDELKQPWAKKDIDLNSLLFIDDEEQDAPIAKGDLPSMHHTNGEGSDAFQAWLATNVERQRQPGYNLVHVSIVRGDVFVEQWHQLAEIARDFAGGRARLDQQQNLVFRWVNIASLPHIFARLQEAGLADAGRHEITDIVTCPGTDTCKLGITSSMGLNMALREALSGVNLNDDPLIRRMHIKASGCPNSCGQHHIADIGFHGAAMKGGKGQQIPAYEIFLGGTYDAGEVNMGMRLRARVPAKQAPNALKSILSFYQQKRSESEHFRDFVERIGKEPFEDLIKSGVSVGPLNRENVETYMDWERTVIYKLERGEGECAV